MKREIDGKRAKHFFELGTDEMNFAEFPMASIADYVAGDQKTLTFEDEITDASTQRKVQRKLVVAANELYGLPTPADSDLLLLLIDYTVRQNGFTDRKVMFRRSELVERLGWGDGGKTFRRVDESLRRWASATLYYNGAWWDSSVKRWMSRTFHVIEALELRGKEEEFDDSLCSFTWNEVVFQSFKAKNIRPLDINVYFRLTRAASRRAFRFLGKRFYRTRQLAFDLKTFACEHIGFSRQYDTGQIKRLLRPAFAELEAIGFLLPQSDVDRFVRVKRGSWKVVLVQAGSSASLPCDAPSGSGLIDELCKRGVHAAAAKRLVSLFPGDRIERQLLAFDRLVAVRDRRVSKNPPGFLVRAIEEDYPLGELLETKRAKTAVPRSNLSVNHRVAAERNLNANAESSAMPAWRSEFESLPADKKHEAEQAALATADSHLAEGLERAKQSGHVATAESYRSLILERHFQRMKSKAA